MTEKTHPLLGKKLVFGDLQQIKIINEENKLEEEKLKTYKCTVNFSGSYTTYVQAYDKDEAEEMAKEEGFDLADCDDVETESIDVEEGEVKDDHIQKE
jgi:hypothetical protein